MVMVSFYPAYGVYALPIMAGIMLFLAVVFYKGVFDLFVGLSTSTLDYEGYDILNIQISLVLTAATIFIYFKYSTLIAGFLAPMVIIGVCANILIELIQRGYLEIKEPDEDE